MSDWIFEGSNIESIDESNKNQKRIARWHEMRLCLSVYGGKGVSGSREYAQCEPLENGQWPVLSVDEFFNNDKRKSIRLTAK